jgi:putative endonuclease
MSNSNKMLYVGVTNNLERRAFEHKAKLIPGFTRKYNLFKLVYFEPFADIRVAIRREKADQRLAALKEGCSDRIGKLRME